MCVLCFAMTSTSGKRSGDFKTSLTNGRGSWVVGVGVGVGEESITMINMNIIFISHI